ncbi:mechanosensitive ion channel family protein [Membranihabitans marinus]|uniref:mechanosensitive ion channel family protein n=1 Tax=Membranihabitans marinus TaxID=1227546 RepID=UPI001F020BA7|nr:mechanosensitive ion channel domain-containing protein [Membranihabitans marinus]
MNNFSFLQTAKIILLLWMILGSHFLVAQDFQPDLSNPYNSVKTHLYFLQSDHYETSKAALPFEDYSEDETDAIENAIKLKQILDGQGLYVYMNTLPKDADYTDTSSLSDTYTLFPDKLPIVYLERKNKQWVFSQETIAAIPNLHRETYPFGTSFLMDMLPVKSGKKFMGFFLWQIYGLLFAIVICILLYWVFKWLVRKLFNFISNRFTDTIFAQQLKSNSDRFIKLLSLIFVFTAMRIVIAILQFPIEFSRFLIIGLRIATTILVVMLFIQVSNFIKLYLIKWSSKTDSLTDDQLVPIVDSILKLIIITLGVIQVLRLMDVNVTALIAGVSLGGLAIALAAQDTVKNLLGSITIFLDRPFKVGDWVINGEIEGAVEEVGFRTTKIRTVDSSLISIPNGNIVNTSVKNMGLRHFRLYNTVLGLQYDTPVSNFESFMEALKSYIQNHPNLDHENYWVYFTTFDSSSLNIMFRVRILTNNFAEELTIKEEINFGIMRLAEAANVSFAFPSRTIYMDSGDNVISPPDSGKMQEIIQALKNRQ